MGFIVWIIVGLIAGWLASRVMDSRGGLIRNLVDGLIGAVVGGILFRTFNVMVVPDFWGNLITATIGAVIFLLVWRAIRRA